MKKSSLNIVVIQCWMLGALLELSKVIVLALNTLLFSHKQI